MYVDLDGFGGTPVLAGNGPGFEQIELGLYSFDGVEDDDCALSNAEWS